MNKSWGNMNLKKILINHWLDMILLLLFVVWMVVLVRRQTELRFLVEWGDESETIIVTKMMASGQRLYTDIYNNHGPLVFLPGFLISKMGDYFIDVYRWIPMVLQWISLLAIYCSPLFQTIKQRVFSTIILGSVMVYFFPLIYGHTYLYQTISGLFMIIAMVQYILPTLMHNKTSAINTFIGVFLLTSLPFLAITNAPFVVLGFLATFDYQKLRSTFLGIFFALVLNLGFLIIYGSWDGYIAYHYYLNFEVLYSGQGINAFLLTLLSFYSNNFTHFLTLIIIIVEVMVINHKRSWIDQLRGLFLIPMLVSLVIRGGDVYTLSGLMYLYAMLGMSAILFANLDYQKSLIEEGFHITPLLGMSVIATLLLTFPLPNDDFYYTFLPETEFSRIVKRVTTEEDRILSLSFRSYEYIVSDRLPASAHFIYLSIQAKYNQNPYKDIYVSIAEDVKKNRPKLILIDEWNIILDESDQWYNYASDLMQVVNDEYYRLKDKDIYVRKDINLLDYGLDPYYGYIIQ